MYAKDALNENPLRNLVTRLMISSGTSVLPFVKVGLVGDGASFFSVKVFLLRGRSMDGIAMSDFVAVLEGDREY
jgi:hypothetical protein